MTDPNLDITLKAAEIESGDCTDALRQNADRAHDRLYGFLPDGADGENAALEQIRIICQDNAGDSCNQQMALDFVRRVAISALSPSGPKNNGAQTCTCGQAGHGNAHEPDCPLSGYRPVKSERQEALAPSGTESAEPVATPQQVQEACAQVAVRAAESDEAWAAKYPDEAVKFEQRAHRAKTIATSIRALIPSPPLPSGGDREALCEAIRAYCRTVSKTAVHASSDGVDRIYYAGLSVQGLADAILSLPVQSISGPDKEAAVQILAERFLGSKVEHLASTMIDNCRDVVTEIFELADGRSGTGQRKTEGTNERLKLSNARPVSDFATGRFPEFTVPPAITDAKEGRK